MTNVHRTITTALVTAAVAATSVLVLSPAAEAAPAKGRNASLAEVLAADGSKFDKKWGDFDILDNAVSAVLEAKPDSAVGVLAKPRTKLTAFLPTDRAFRVLATQLTGEKPRSEKATFNALADAAGIDVIETVLLYHVVPGKTLGAGRVAVDGKVLKTAQGGKITVDVTRKAVSLVDADPDLRDPRVVATNINKGNPQIAHAIDRVLLPVDL